MSEQDSGSPIASLLRGLLSEQARTWWDSHPNLAHRLTAEAVSASNLGVIIRAIEAMATQKVVLEYHGMAIYEFFDDGSKEGLALRRDVSGGWERGMGDSWEIVDECQDLEAAYQRLQGVLLMAGLGPATLCKALE